MRMEGARKRREEPEAKIFDDSEAIMERAREIRRRQSKPGKLGLPELLDKRRWEHLIPDEAWKEQATFERIHIYQIGRTDVGMDEGDLKGPAKMETWGDTGIVMPSQSRDYIKHETPRGIIVSAGLDALETLHSNGLDVGHIVGFIRNAPWAKEICYVNGTPIYLLMMNCGDITGSEDLAANIRAGRVKYTWENGEYWYVDETGRKWKPKKPWTGDDFA